MATLAQTLAAEGQVITGRSRYSTVPIGSVAYSSMGTNTTTVAGTIYWAEVWIGRNMNLTGVGILNGATVGTDKGIVALYDNNGLLLANSALAGVTTVGANAFQQYPFTAVLGVIGPARYFIAYQPNGTTDTFRSIAVSTFIDSLTASATGAFATLTALTVPTTITADRGPVAYVYA